MSHRCCGCGEVECNCRSDCNDLDAPGSDSEEGCPECCWSEGDVVRLSHDWGTSTYIRRETQYASLPAHAGRPQCADVTYEGGSIEVEYLMVGCSTTCPDLPHARPRVLFALNPRFGGVTWSKTEQRYVVEGSGWTYPLRQYLALVCQSDAASGDYQWWTYDDCLDPFLPEPCVALCRTACAEVDYEPCNGTTPRDYCGGGVGLPRNGPDWFNCGHCVDAVADCGGYRSYCGYRWVTSECAMSGQEYGQQFDASTPPELVCVTDCGADMDGDFHPIETCEVVVFQTLTILPPEGAERNCLWHEWTANSVEYQCCKDAGKVVGGDDVSVPSALTNPTIVDQSWPDTGWTADPGPCDCFATPQTVTECDPVECPAVTDLAAVSVKEVCQ